MQSATTGSTTHSQWLFPISALSCTPTAQERSLHEEMYDRSRGIEFLYRLGTSIGLFVVPNLSHPRSVHIQPLSLRSHSPGLFTAATWFHRFFMRYSMLDYHRQVCVSLCRHSSSVTSLIRHQTIAAACIFLATKTEECGRKLRDVARVCQSKAKGIDVRDIPESGAVCFFFFFLIFFGGPTLIIYFAFPGNRRSLEPDPQRGGGPHRSAVL